MELIVFLGINGEESFTVNLHNNSFINKWINELQWCLDNCEFNQQEAFAEMLSLEESSLILLDSCTTINSYMKGFIDIKQNILEQPQSYFNYLHSKFEQLNGPFNSPTRLFRIAPPELKSAIRNLNFFTHRCESKKISSPCLYISFNKDQYRRYPLEKEDYDFFKFKSEPGTLFLQYVELGKEFLDLYKDGLPIDYVNFRNLHYYSGECFLRSSEFDIFKNVKFIEWLRSNNIDPTDKFLGHGKIPLGIVDDIESYKHKVSKYRYLNRIEIKGI